MKLMLSLCHKREDMLSILERISANNIPCISLQLVSNKQEKLISSS